MYEPMVLMAVRPLTGDFAIQLLFVFHNSQSMSNQLVSEEYESDVSSRFNNNSLCEKFRIKTRNKD
jgi:hypothetical protein